VPGPGQQESPFMIIMEIPDFVEVGYFKKGGLIFHRNIFEIQETFHFLK
jgi:hypothetical protein